MRRRQLTDVRRAAVLVSVVAVIGILTGGVANAYWTSAGTGAGSGATGDATDVTLGPATPSAALYPGGQSDVVLTATNPNSSTVRIVSLALDISRGTGGFAVDAGHPGCEVSTLSFSTQTAGWDLPARTGSVDGSSSLTLTNALSMGSAAADACQGATFTVYLVAGR